MKVEKLKIAQWENQIGQSQLFKACYNFNGCIYPIRAFQGRPCMLQTLWLFVLQHRASSFRR